MLRARFPHPLVLLLLLPILFTTATAQEGFWTQTGGPAGGHILSVVRVGGAFLAGTIGGGVFSTSNNGTSWHSSNNGLADQTVAALAYHPNGTVVAGTFLGDVSAYYSTDAGSTWHSASTGSLHPSFSAIVLSSAGTLYGTGSLSSNDPGLYRSSDAGRTWDRIAFADTGLAAITVAPDGTLIVGADGMPPTGISSILRSTDNGAHWSTVATLPMPIVALTVDSSGGFWAGRRDGIIYKSIDRGARWDSVIDLSGGTPLNIGTMTTMTEGTILIGTDRAVFRSTDRGGSWSSVGGWPTGSLVTSFASGSDGIVIGGSYISGARVSSDHGETWNGANDGLVATLINSVAGGSEGHALAGDVGGANYTEDRGSGWRFSKRITDIGAVAIGADGTLYVSSVLNAGQSTVTLIQYSTDSGGSWTVTAPPAATITVMGIARSGNSIFMAGRNLLGAPMHGLLRSDDNGKNWTELTSGFDGTDASAIAFDSHGTVFSTASGIAYRSTDNGDHWAQLSVGGAPIYVAVDRQDIVYLITDADVLYRSTSGGEGWEMVGTTPHHFSAIVGNRKGELYAASDGYGVFLSRDRGGSWTPVNDSLHNLHVTSLALDSAGFLYAGTFGSGIFRSLRSTSAGVTAQREITAPLLEEPAPNPAAAEVTIRFSLRGAAEATISLSDPLGRVVATFDAGHLEPGSYAHRLDLSAIPTGIYFCTLRAGGAASARPIVVAR